MKAFTKDTTASAVGAATTTLLHGLTRRLTSDAPRGDVRGMGAPARQHVEALSLNIASLEGQCRRADGLGDVPLQPASDAVTGEGWRAAMDAVPQVAGGIDGDAAALEDGEAAIPRRSPFERSHEQRLDSFTTRRDRDVPPKEQAGEPWHAYVFRTFMNGIGAGDNVASIIVDAPAHRSWECLYDLARHGWDEYRHATMGFSACESWATTPPLSRSPRASSRSGTVCRWSSGWACSCSSTNRRRLATSTAAAKASRARATPPAWSI